MRKNPLENFVYEFVFTFLTSAQHVFLVLLAVQETLECLCTGVHWRMSLMSLSLLPQQCPACFACLTCYSANTGVSVCRSPLGNINYEFVLTSSAVSNMSCLSYLLIANTGVSMCRSPLENVTYEFVLTSSAVSSVFCLSYLYSANTGVFMCRSPLENITYEFVLTSSAVANMSCSPLLDGFRDRR